MEGDICPDGPRVASVQGCPSQATHPCDAVSLHGLVPPARPEAPPRANFRARDRTRFTSACFHGSPPQDSTDEDARPHPDLGGDLYRRLFTSASSRGPAPSSAAARLPWRRGPLLLSRRLPRTAIAPSIPHASSIYLRLLPAPARRLPPRGWLRLPLKSKRGPSNQTAPMQPIPGPLSGGSLRQPSRTNRVRFTSACLQRPPAAFRRKVGRLTPRAVAQLFRPNSTDAASPWTAPGARSAQNSDTNPAAATRAPQGERRKSLVTSHRGLSCPRARRLRVSYPSPQPSPPLPSVPAPPQKSNLRKQFAPV